MHVETRSEFAAAIVETVLREDPTYTRPASTEHHHAEQFYLCSTSVTIFYKNTITVDLSKENAFLQTVTTATDRHFDRLMTITSSPILHPYESRYVLDSLGQKTSNNVALRQSRPAIKQFRLQIFLSTTKFT